MRVARYGDAPCFAVLASDKDGNPAGCMRSNTVSKQDLRDLRSNKAVDGITHLHGCSQSKEKAICTSSGSELCAERDCLRSLRGSLMVGTVRQTDVCNVSAFNALVVVQTCAQASNFSKVPQEP